MRSLFLLPLLVTSFFVVFTKTLYAESLTVSMQVGTTQLSVSGYTSPNALVVLKEDGAVIGTTTSTGSGTFSLTITVAVPALHSYELYATDNSSRPTRTISYNLSIAGGTTTSLDNIVLPPTVSLLGTTLTGASYPGSTLTITSSLGDVLTLTAPTSGNWSADLSSLTSGTHSLQATATVGSYLSLSSTAVSYTPPAPSPSPTPTPSSSPTSSSSPASQSSAPSPSPSPSLSPSPTPAPFFLPLYDQNEDGRLTLSELYSVIKNWLSAHLPCDLNRDQACNLIDLSILLYYFER